MFQDDYGAIWGEQCVQETITGHVHLCGIAAMITVWPLQILQTILPRGLHPRVHMSPPPRPCGHHLGTKVPVLPKWLDNAIQDVPLMHGACYRRVYLDVRCKSQTENNAITKPLLNSDFKQKQGKHFPQFFLCFP
jgi:hypothetical protein